ncbi:hypothetical protein IV73_GL000140 [Weissella kandleri]|uniref:Uncharacterized protein n=1 Tax=Weissella kandleri TaxID=1616 RepID=A0A0R2JE59_9LACO|nr:DUF669 domain-containing protein [Weissella kandleri]KRN75650.1 hypothetical protein IV73_GL000140 [Weissella kandleri]
MFTVNSKKKAGTRIVEFAGKYNVEISAAEFKMSQSNREMMVITYRVLDGEQEGNIIPYDRLVDDSADEGVTNKTYFSYERINSFLVDGLQVENGIQFDLRQASQLVGKQLSVNVGWKKDNYDNKTKYQLKVKSYHPLMQDGSKPDMNKPRPQAPDSNSGNSNAFSNSQPSFGAQPTNTTSNQDNANFGNAQSSPFTQQVAQSQKSPFVGGQTVNDDDLPF